MLSELSISDIIETLKILYLIYIFYFNIQCLDPKNTSVRQQKFHFPIEVVIIYKSGL